MAARKNTTNRIALMTIATQDATVKAARKSRKRKANTTPCNNCAQNDSPCYCKAADVKAPVVSAAGLPCGKCHGVTGHFGFCTVGKALTKVQTTVAKLDAVLAKPDECKHGLTPALACLECMGKRAKPVAPAKPVVKPAAVADVAPVAVAPTVAATVAPVAEASLGTLTAGCSLMWHKIGGKPTPVTYVGADAKHPSRCMVQELIPGRAPRLVSLMPWMLTR